MTVPEAAEKLGLSVSSVRLLASQGKIRHFLTAFPAMTGQDRE